ncbi:Holliday junction resolvase [Candidatus Woesearchaeota archaeon]|nr:Holliday junction resolvase [Candidatus Woesearchaeota archaeon]
MKTKAKGSNAERELFHKFWSSGWACMRAAGSGSTSMPAPDILAGNVTRRLAIEVKVTKAIKQYLTRKEVEELKEFSRIFGAEPWIGVKFNNVDWYFINPEDLDETEGQNYVVSIPIAKRKGLLFEEAINK